MGVMGSGFKNKNKMRVYFIIIIDLFFMSIFII